MENQNKGLNRDQSQKKNRRQSGQQSPERSDSVGRKPGEMDAPRIPENVKENFE